MRPVINTGGDGELKFLQNIADQEFNLNNLKNDRKFWARVSQSNQFLSSVVMAFIERSRQDTDGLRKFFKVIFLKINSKELFHKCLQKIFNSFLREAFKVEHGPRLTRCFVAS